MTRTRPALLVALVAGLLCGGALAATPALAPTLVTFAASSCPVGIYDVAVTARETTTGLTVQTALAGVTLPVPTVDASLDLPGGTYAISAVTTPRAGGVTWSAEPSTIVSTAPAPSPLPVPSPTPTPTATPAPLAVLTIVSPANGMVTPGIVQTTIQATVPLTNVRISLTRGSYGPGLIVADWLMYDAVPVGLTSGSSRFDPQAAGCAPACDFTLFATGVDGSGTTVVSAGVAITFGTPSPSPTPTATPAPTVTPTPTPAVTPEPAPPAVDLAPLVAGQAAILKAIADGFASIAPTPTSVPPSVSCVFSTVNSSSVYIKCSRVDFPSAVLNGAAKVIK